MDAAEAVRAALQYEIMHEEGDEDVGETCRHLTFTAATTDTASDTTCLLHADRSKPHDLPRA